MRTNHRIRRSTTQPEPASIGAPFFGVYPIGIGNFQAPDEIEIRALKIPAGGGSAQSIPVWTPNKSIDINAFEIFNGSVKSVPISATVNATGEEIKVNLAANLDNQAFYVIPSHPALISSTGQQCGGGSFQAGY